MSNFDDFKEGERVAHISVGDGTVTAVSSLHVCVAFDQGPKGFYDRQWFDRYPAYLFHRSEPSSALTAAKGASE